MEEAGRPSSDSGRRGGGAAAAAVGSWAGKGTWQWACTQGNRLRQQPAVLAGEAGAAVVLQYSECCRMWRRGVGPLVPRPEGPESAAGKRTAPSGCGTGSPAVEVWVSGGGRRAARSGRGKKAVEGRRAAW